MALLQKKVKWTEKKANLKEGDMVLVMDEQRIPLRWPVGRVTKVYAGLVRVVDVYTKGKTYKRPVGKLALLDDTINEKAVEEPIVKEAKDTQTSTKNDKGVKKKTLINPLPVKGFVVTILAMLTLINVRKTRQVFIEYFSTKFESIHRKLHKNCGCHWSLEFNHALWHERIL